ncbi:MAG: trypsin-like peptidase domain-containing protein [Lachnospiraceae bacterium]|nr:trypsin-like peptidase domain-containing protein [Lachnospiraceae bacterium]
MNKVILNRITDTIKKTVITVLLIVSVSGFAACSAAGSRGPESTETVFGRDIPGFFVSEVVISTGTAYGGGTLLDSPSGNGTAYIVSAAHLVRSFGSSSEVTDAEGNKLHCEAVWMDEAADIGLLKAEGLSGKVKPAKPVSVLNVPAEITCLDAEHNALAAGFIAGTGLKTDTSDDLLYLLIDAKEGMSGNGLYDPDGSYCGMIAGSFDDSGAAGISADKILTVIGIYEEYKGGDIK